jgi:hypothetical protein
MWKLAGMPLSVKLQASYMAYVDLAHNWGKNVESEFGADIHENSRKLNK